MKTVFKNLILTPFVLLISSCSTQTKVQCENTKWHQRGVQMALDGQTKESQNEFVNQCSSQGVAIDQAKFDQGYAYGLKLFCRPDHGYQYGLQGFEYREICDVKKRAAFLEKYLLGRKAFLNQEIHEKSRLIC